MEMKIFEIGDRIKCVSPRNDQIKKNKCYYVIDRYIRSSFCSVQLSLTKGGVPCCNKHYFITDQFELVESGNCISEKTVDWLL